MNSSQETGYDYSGLPSTGTDLGLYVLIGVLLLMMGLLLYSMVKQRLLR